MTQIKKDIENETNAKLVIKEPIVENERILLFKHLINSNKLPKHIKTIEDAVTVAQMGEELGFKIMQSFHYIIPIDGKLSLSAKAIGALLKRNNISYITLEDGVYVFEDGSVDNYKTKNGVEAIDRRTSIKFTRNNIDEIVTFTWNDAKRQELTEKLNWKKMPKEMLFARCLAKGANRVAPDKLLGLYTIEEMVDTFLDESKVLRNESGEVIEIKN